MPIQQLAPGKYQFRVATGRDPITGRYGRAVKNVTGPVQTGKQAPKVVRDEYAQFVSDVRAGLATKRTGATLNDAWAAFLQVARLEELTRQDYVSKWELYVRQTIGPIAVSALTPMDCTRLYANLSERGLKPGTIRKVHAIIRNAGKTACNELGWIRLNPAANARLPRMTRQEIDPPAAESVAKLIELAHADPDFEVYLELAIGSGGRRGEVLALRRSDIEDDGEGMTLHLRHSAYQLKGQPVRLKDTKSHQTRRVALGPEVAKMVRGHLARQSMRAHSIRVEMVEDPFLFSAEADGREPWRPDLVTKRFTALWRQTGAPPARLHDLRHFHATELVDAGVPLTVIQKRLGHSNVAVTSIYAHGRAEADQAAAAAFEARRRAQ